MVDKNKKPKVKSRHIIYTGNDDSYFNTLRGRFVNNYPHIEFDFSIIFDRKENSYPETFLKIFEANHYIIYIDFSINVNDQLLLTQMLSRDMKLRKVPFVGLVANKDLLKACWSVGINFTHIKCGETYDAFYDPCVYLMGKSVRKPDFAKAKFKKDALLTEESRIGYMTQDFIHVETNLNLEKGDVVELFSNIPSDINRSNKFIVKKSGEDDLYYDFEGWYDLAYTFLDRPEDNPDDDAAIEEIEDEQDRINAKEDLRSKRAELLREYEQSLEEIITRNKKYIEHYAYDSRPKKTKVYMIDKKLDILKGLKQPLDSHPFVLRVSSQFDPNYEEIEKIKPHVITFRFLSDLLLEEEGFSLEYMNDKKTSAEDKAYCENLVNECEKIQLSILAGLVKKIQDLKGYRPILIVFNCKKYSSKSLQDSYNYPMIISYMEDMKLSMAIDMAKVFEKKQNTVQKKKIEKKIADLRKSNPMKYSRVKPSDFEEKRHYLSKTYSISYISCKHKILIDAMTESEITFVTEKFLKLTTYKVDFPIDMSLTLVPIDDQPFLKEGDMKRYKGLIHSIDEVDKKELRKFVNKIFFSDLDEKRKQEREAFDELNQMRSKSKES